MDGRTMDVRKIGGARDTDQAHTVDKGTLYASTDATGRETAFRSRPAGDRFRASYQHIEARMKALAEADGTVYLPNPELAGPVDFIFILMEPSFGPWASSAIDAKAKVEGGLRNCLPGGPGLQTSVLHFCIRRYLCQPGQRYHITDISKGAMLGKDAAVDRIERWNRWYPLLLDELQLVAKPSARFFAVGGKVATYLANRGFPQFTPIIHYSPQAQAARSACIVGHEIEFERFKSTISLVDLRATAEEALNEMSVAPSVRKQSLAVFDWAHLYVSDRKLMFCYKLAFENHR